MTSTPDVVSREALGPTRPSQRQKTTVIELLEARCLDFADRQLVECAGERRTYGDMTTIMNNLAKALQAVGVKRGDRVGIMLPNRIETVELFFACARLGAVQVPMNTYIKGEFLSHQLNDCGAQTVVTDSGGLSALAVVLPNLPNLRRIVTVDLVADSQNLAVEVVGYHDLRANPGSGDLPPTVTPNDLCSILYTSGTTGMPKGCMASHGYFVHSGEVFAHELMGGLIPGDIFFTTMPLFHITGLASGVLSPLNEGLSAVIEPSFSASSFFQRAAEAHATVTMGVGSMAHALLATAPSPADRAHHLRKASFAPLSAAVQHSFAERFGVQVGALGYGQTECFPVTIDVPHDAGGPAKAAATSGRPVPWLEVRIVDDDDNELPRQSVGEVVVRPETTNAMFSGYWQQPEATVHAFRNLWHHTGDLGVMDQNGLVTFVDRKKDAIRRRGENISSFELEFAISKHPAVAEVAVHGVPSPFGEDDVKAWIVPAPGARPDAEELFEHFTQFLPYFAIPRYVAFIDALPRNHTGKVLKNKLKERPIFEEDTWDFEKLGLFVHAVDRRGHRQTQR